MKTSTKRILSIGLAGLFFIGILVVFGSLIRPEMTKINEKRALLSSKETLFSNEQDAVSQVRDLIGQFQSIVKLQETVSLALPLEENITQILNQLQSIANLSNVEMRSFSIRPLAFEASRQPLVKRLGVLELDISIDGPYDNIKNFLRSLETNVRVVNAKSFRLATISGEGSPPGEDFNMTLTVEVYHQE
ncbi:MAG: type 4a pilus biogenesis protein PilO [Patescibacteria group bacterium]|nr:type 4a pilus biogenesis protein PilO [Patescibacteria group bacterium]